MDSIILVTTEWAVHTEYIDDNSEILAVYTGCVYWPCILAVYTGCASRRASGRCSRYNLNLTHPLFHISDR